MQAVQDLYAEEFAWCFGCGRLNPEGYHLRSFWDGRESVARFTPKPVHMAIPGFVNGGLLASLVDCHATGTAAAAFEQAAGRTVGAGPVRRFVTASLRVDYLRPTTLGPELVLRGRATSVAGRKVVVEIDVSVQEEVTVRGQVVCVEIPEAMTPKHRGTPSPPRGS